MNFLKLKYYEKYYHGLSNYEKDYLQGFINTHEKSAKEDVTHAIQLLVSIEEFRVNHKNLLELMSIWNMVR